MTDPDSVITGRRVLWSLPTGLYLLGSTGDPTDGPWNLMSTNQVAQVATEPRVIAVSVEQGSWTNELVATTGLMALSVLWREDRAVVRRFVKPISDLELDARARPCRASGEAIHLAPNGAPVLDAALGWLALCVVASKDFSSHRVYFAEVTDAGATPELLSAPPSDKSLSVLRMEDTRMNYGG